MVQDITSGSTYVMCLEDEVMPVDVSGEEEGEEYVEEGLEGHDPGIARCNREMSSTRERPEGKAGGALRPPSSSARVCVKYGIVEMSGERAHGLVFEARSCSSVGSMYLWNGC